MIYALWEIVLPLLLAAAAGLGLGWLLWRWRHRQMSSDEWTALQSRAGQLAAAQADVERLSADVGGLGDEKTELHERLTDASADLDDRLRRIEATEAELAKERDQVSRLSTDLNAAVLEAKESQAKVVTLRTDLDDATSRAQMMQAEVEAVTARHLALSGELDQARALLATVTSDRDALQLRAEAAEADLRAAVGRNAEATTLRSDLEDATVENAVLRADLDASRARVAELESIADSAITERDEAHHLLTVNQNELDNTGRQLESTRVELEQIQTDLIRTRDDLAAAVSRSEQSATDASGDVGDADRQRELENAYARIADLEVQLAVGRKAIADLQREASESPTIDLDQIDLRDGEAAGGGDDDSRPARIDDLTLISGVGPKLEQMLHDQGIFTFHQIASLDAAGVQQLNDSIPEFPGRIERDEWVRQARALAQRQGDPSSVSPLDS